jgi:cobalt/nickel transport system permease protein
MHIHFLDPYQDRKSVVHQLDARVKFILTVAFILTVSLTPIGAWPVYILLLAIAVSVILLSDLGVGFVLKRAAIAVPFALAALPMLFTVKGTPWFELSLGFATLTASLEGLERFLSILFKSFISVQMAIVLAMSTPFPQLLAAMRAIRIPKLLVAIFGLMWRYLFVLADEAGRLIRARLARSGAATSGLRTGGSVVWRGKVAGGMAGNLFLRSFERGDRIYNAMAARGYDGEVRSFNVPALSTPNLLVLIGGLGALVVLFLLTRVLG